jgi:gluconate 5-dehydrogenase
MRDPTLQQSRFGYCIEEMLGAPSMSYTSPTTCYTAPVDVDEAMHKKQEAASGFDLTGRRALVTGSSQGIGFALARALGMAGAELVLNGRGVSKLEQSAELLRDSGVIVHTAPFDVTDVSAVADGVDRIEREFGPLHILVNNAGINRRIPLQDITESVWHEIMTTNVDGVFFVAQSVARRMIPRGAGKIVNVCSVLSEAARAGVAPYATSKAAVKMLTKGMCADWGKYGIQVNGVGPGYICTELTKPLQEDAEFSRWLLEHTPAGRWGRVEDIAGPVVFLCSAAADFVNGHVLYVDGGLTSTL